MVSFYAIGGTGGLLCYNRFLHVESFEKEVPERGSAVD